jgi:hypothetical protein
MSRIKLLAGPADPYLHAAGSSAASGLASPISAQLCVSSQPALPGAADKGTLRASVTAVIGAQALRLKPERPRELRQQCFTRPRPGWAHAAAFKIDAALGEDVEDPALVLGPQDRRATGFEQADRGGAHITSRATSPWLHPSRSRACRGPLP